MAALTSGRPAREARPLALSAEAGWNALSGAGLVLSWSPEPHFALDGGLGFGLSGPQAGLQARYNLIKNNLTPYVGVGVAQAFGSSGAVDLDDFEVEIAAVRSARATVGLSYISPGGFTMLLGLGYAFVFEDEAYRVVSGSPGPSQRDTLDLLLGSGPVASIAFGYSFMR